MLLFQIIKSCVVYALIMSRNYELWLTLTLTFVSNFHVHFSIPPLAPPPPNVLIPYAWRNVDFIYPSDVERNNAIQSGSFAPSSVLINDVDVWSGKSIDI